MSLCPTFLLAVALLALTVWCDLLSVSLSLSPLIALIFVLIIYTNKVAAAALDLLCSLHGV
jgi:hypothetical protein